MGMQQREHTGRFREGQLQEGHEGITGCNTRKSPSFRMKKLGLFYFGQRADKNIDRA